MREPDGILPLPWRKSMALEIEHQAGVLKRLEDNTADCRLNRDRLSRLLPDLPDIELELAIGFLDSVATLLGQIRRRLEAG